MKNLKNVLKNFCKKTFALALSACMITACAGALPETANLNVNAAESVSETSQTLTNSSTISATSITLGETVTITANATGGTAPYTYQYFGRLKGDTTWTALTKSTTTATYTKKPAQAKTYEFAVKITDSDGSCARKYFTVTVNSVSQLTNNSTISATSITLGETVTITANASGGTAPYTYQYFGRLKGDTTWTALTKSTTTATYTKKPAQAKTYEFAVKITDSDGSCARKYFTVEVTEPLTNNSTMSDTAIDLGESVTLNGAASGGTSPYQFACSYRHESETVWSTLKNYNTTSSYTWTPDKTGKYNVCIKVKDANSTEIKNFFTLTVTAKLTNDSTVSSTKITLGDTLTLNGAASGGTSPYSYSYCYKTTAETEWTEIEDYGTTESISFKPSQQTAYDICIKVKDANENVSEKYFTVYVYQSMTVNYGGSVTITPPSDTGTSPFKYAFYCKKSSESTWELLQSYSTESSIQIRPSEMTQYSIMAYVKDNDGIIRKYFYTVDVVISDKIYEELEIINEERANAGVAPVTLDLQLTFVANVRAEELITSFSHTRPNGESCFTVLDEYNVSVTSTAGENIAMGFKTAESVMNGFMNSEGHRNNILNPDFTKVGLGLNGVYWAQMFSD